MGGHIAAHLPTLLAAIRLGKGEDFVEGAIIEVILEFARQKIIRCRGMLRSPSETVILFPLTFEGLTVATTRPKLRLLEKQVVNARVDDALDVLFFQIIEEVHGRHDIRRVGTMQERVAQSRHLRLVHVRCSIPLA